MSEKSEAKKLERLARAERAIDDALYNTGRVDRSEITRKARADAEEAIAKVDLAMEADEVADEATRFSLISELNGNRDRTKVARRREREARRKARQEHRAATKSARQAYDAIKFSDPTKMGLMRVVQIGFGLHIFMTLVGLLFSSRDTFAYSSTNIMRWIMVMFEGMAFWMFLHRFRIARPMAIGLSVLAMTSIAVTDIANHTFSIGFFLAQSLLYLLLLIYFLFSKRVETTLVNEVSDLRADRGEEAYVIERHGWPFVRNLVIYFISFSVLGHWMEMAMCQLIRLKLVEGEYDPTNTMLWRDWLYPFPMEGAAVVIIALALYPLFIWLKQKMSNKVLPYVISFLANALTCSLIEFSMGLVVNADHQLWDYSENFGNIMGQVCLQNALAFGVACSVIAWFVYPSLERWIARVPHDIMNIAFAAIVVFGGIIWSLYIFEPATVDEPLDSPIESSDLGLHVLYDSGSADISYVVSSMKEDADILRSQLERNEDLTESQRDELAQQLDEIERRIESMEATLGPAE